MKRKKKIKQVNPEKYNKEYFEQVYSIYDFTKKIDVTDKNDFCWSISKLIKPNKNDLVVDFGCGVGHLAFFLYLMYKCRIIGIDYAKDAILLCEKNKKKFIKAHNVSENKITFIHKDNNSLPHFKNIKVVYLQDVIEHLYDEEIDAILTTFKTWNDKKLYVAIRTDNNHYIKYVRPFIYLISVLTNKRSWAEIKESGNWEKERHVNLTTIRELTGKLNKNSFKVEKAHYAPVSFQKTTLQLGKLGNIRPIAAFIYLIARFTPFLRPSFYLLASYEVNKSW